tara:strand:+ start:23833 stop:24408 length:576 start_codon:yes stop_codon:yes gene_type:complete
MSKPENELNEEPMEVPVEEEAQQAETVDVASLLKQIDLLQAESNQHQNNFLRARADLENYRKRAVREKEALYKTASTKLVEELLPVLDNFKLGIASAHKHPEANVVTEGFEMVFGQLNSLLSAQGLETIDPQGEAFDPNEHECVAHHAHSSIPADHVMEVARVGYRFHGQLLRAATVIVSSGPESAQQDKE